MEIYSTFLILNPLTTAINPEMKHRIHPSIRRDMMLGKRGVVMRGMVAISSKEILDAKTSDTATTKITNAIEWNLGRERMVGVIVNI